MANVSDMELVRVYERQGSEEAFAELVQRHINLVYSVAFRHAGIAAHAEEITQAVFIILARKAASLRPDTILEGWLYETTRFTALSFLRRERRRQFREQEAFMQSTLHEPADAAAWNQLAPLLDEAMARLGRQDRDALMLRFFKDKDLREVAGALRVSEAAAQKRVVRAVEKLRLFFKKRGVVLSGAVIAGAVSANSVHAAPVALAKTVSAVALTKGVAAGASTLTLIKGALKLMAWTKAKMAIVVGAGVLLAAGTVTVVVTETRDHFGVNDAVWNDDQNAVNALKAAPPMVILRHTKFPLKRAGGFLVPENGKLAIRCQPMEVLLTHAFNWSRARMIFDTQLPTNRFDYLVTLPENQPEALQQKIREQLGIMAHQASRDVPVYVMKGRKLPGLKPVSSEPIQQIVENGHYFGRLSDMWYSLECYLKKPLLAEIDPGEDCEVDLRWGDAKGGAFPAEPDVAALRKALKEQLGLEMVLTNRTVEMLVVEKMK